VPGKNLTRDEARERADLLSVATYDVALDLTTGPTSFRTRSTVAFASSVDGASTFIDLIAASVEQITLNGDSLDPATHFDGVRVQLPRLRSGPNQLTIDATGVYMNTGEGLHRFVDPVDDEVYLYTQFEVADCRRMFAVFEQPDLKATYAFTVTAAGALAGRVQRADTRAGGNRRDRGSPQCDVDLRAHTEHVLLHHCPYRRPV